MRVPLSQVLELNLDLRRALVVSPHPMEQKYNRLPQSAGTTGCKTQREERSVPNLSIHAIKIMLPVLPQSSSTENLAMASILAVLLNL